MNHWTLRAFLIPNLMNIEPIKLLLLHWDASNLSASSSSCPLPYKNAFTDNDSGYFFPRTTNTSNGQQQNSCVTASWPFRAPHTNRPRKAKAFTLSLSLRWWHHFWPCRIKKENSSVACKKKERWEIKKSRGVSGVSERAMNHADVPGRRRQRRPLSWAPPW